MGRNTYNLSRQAFIVDQNSISQNSGRQVAWQHVPDRFRAGSQIVKAAAAALAAATSITVDALPVDLPAGTLIHFGGAGEFARLTAPALAGDTSITVEALPNGIEDNDEGVIPGDGPKTIPAGSVMAEITTGDDKGQLVLRAYRPTGSTDPATCFLLTPAVQGDVTEAKTGYGCLTGGMLYENLLPDASGDPMVLPSDYKTELQAAGVGTGFGFEQYYDSRAD